MDSGSWSSRGAQPVIVSFISVSIAFLVLACRLITRVTLVRNLGPEDYVITVSLLLAIALSALICVEYNHGQGRHIATISQSDLLLLFKAFWASVPVYQLSLTLTKLSILLQYWRVFVSTKVRNAIITLFVITAVYGLWSVFGTLFMCMPVSAFWDSTLSEGHCMNKYSVWFANASLNIITDIAIFILPMPVLKDLHLPRRQRVALMGVFGLGGFVCLISVLRLKSLWVISQSTDITYDNGGAASWSSLEVNIAIICASLPTLRKAITRFFPKVFASSSVGGGSKAASTKRRRSGFKRFPIAQEATNWANVLQVPEEYGKSSAKVGLNSKIETTSSSMEEDDICNEKHRSGIKVVTTTTQEVLVVPNQPFEEYEAEEDVEIAELEAAYVRPPGWNRKLENYALMPPHGI